MIKEHISNVVVLPASQNLQKRDADSYVNWRVGSLHCYESIAGIAAKFCYLNRIVPFSFISFLERFIPNYQSRDFWMLFDKADFDIRCFTNTLGESEECGASLRGTPFLPPQTYTGFSYRPLNEDLSYDIVFCPQCIQFGYHAFFHQLPWLKKCLIHGCDLQKLGRSDNRYCGRRDVLYIKDVYRLFFGNDSRWNYSDYECWIRKGEVEASHVIPIYLAAIQEVGLSKSLLEKQIRQYAGSIPYDTSRVFEIIQRLGGESASRILDLGYLYESDRYIRKSLFINRYYFDCLSKLKFTIYEIAQARREWAILLGEESTWSKCAIAAIELMLISHQSCLDLYSKIKRKPSKTTNKSDFDFLDQCPRVVNARHLQEEWLVPWPHREITLAFSVENSVFSGYSYIGRKLASFGLANRVVVERIAASPNGGAQIFSVEAWDLVEWLKDLLDVVLRIKFGGQLWAIFDFESKSDR